MAQAQAHTTSASTGNFILASNTNFAPGIRISGDPEFSSDTEVTLRFSDTTTTTNKAQLKFGENDNWSSEISFGKSVETETHLYGLKLTINNEDSHYQVGDLIKWFYRYNNRSYSHMDTIQRADDYDIFAYSSTGDGKIHVIKNANTHSSEIKELGRVSSATGKVVTDTNGQQMYWGFGADPSGLPKWSGYPQHTQFEKEDTGKVSFENGEVALLGPFDNLHDFCILRFYDHYGGANTSEDAGTGVVNHWGFGIEKGRKVIHVFWQNVDRTNTVRTDATERYGAWIHMKSFEGADSGLTSSQSITTDGKNVLVLDNAGFGIIKIFEPIFKQSTDGGAQPDGNPWNKSTGVNGNALVSFNHIKDFELPPPESDPSLQGCYWSSICINSWHDPIFTETGAVGTRQNQYQMDNADSGYITNGNYPDDIYYDDKIWISKHRTLELNKFVTKDSRHSLIFLGGLSNIYTSSIAIDLDAGKVQLLSYMPNICNQTSFKTRVGNWQALNAQQIWYQSETAGLGRVGVLESYEQPFIPLNKSGVMGFVMTTGLWESGTDRGSPNSDFEGGWFHENLGAENMRRWRDGLAGGAGFGSLPANAFAGLDPSPNVADSWVTSQNVSMSKGMMKPVEANFWEEEYDLDPTSGDASTANSKVYYYYGDGQINQPLGGNLATSWEGLGNPFPNPGLDGDFTQAPNYIDATKQSTHYMYIMKNPQTQLYVVHSHRTSAGNDDGHLNENGFAAELKLAPSGPFGQKTLQFPILEPDVKWKDVGTDLSGYRSGFVSGRFVISNPKSQDGGVPEHYLFISKNNISGDGTAISTILRSVDLSNVDFRNEMDRSIFTAGYGKVRVVTHSRNGPDDDTSNVNEPLMFSTGAGNDIIRTQATDKGGTDAPNYYTPKDYILGDKNNGGFTIGAQGQSAENCPWFRGEDGWNGTGLYNGGMFVFEIVDGYPSSIDNQLFPYELQDEMSGQFITQGKKDSSTEVVTNYQHSWMLNLQVLAYDAQVTTQVPYNIVDYQPSTFAKYNGSSYDTTLLDIKQNFYDEEDTAYVQMKDSLQLISANKGEINTMPAIHTNNQFDVSTISKEASYQADVTQVSEDGWEWEIGDKVWYKISFMYDGFQESPMSIDLNDGFSFSSHLNSKDGSRIKVVIKLSKAVTDTMNRRISHIQLYRSQGSSEDLSAPEFYRLVGSYPLTTGEWSYSSPYWVKTIYDKKDMFASYEELTGMPETLQDTQLHYGVSASQTGYLFVTNCWHKESGGLPNYIFRSKPGKYNIFDWSSDYAVLPERPIALAGFAGKIWAWSKNSMYRINPSNLVLEDIFEGIGCYSESSVVVTDYGMFWADKNMIYRHDGSRTLNLGAPIIAGDKDWSWRAKNETYVPKLVFDYANKQLLCVYKPNISLNTFGCYAWAYHVDRNRWDLYDFEQKINGIKKDIDVLSLDNAEDGSVIFSTQGMGVQKFRGGSSRRAWQYLSKSITCDTPSLKKVFYKLRVNVKDGTVGRMYQFDHNDASSIIMLNKDKMHDNAYEKFLVGGNNDPNRKARNLSFKLFGAVGAVVDSVGAIFRRTGMPK